MKEQKWNEPKNEVTIANALIVSKARFQAFMTSPLPTLHPLTAISYTFDINLTLSMIDFVPVSWKAAPTPSEGLLCLTTSIITELLTSERFKENSPRIWKKNEIIKLYKKLRECSGRVDYWTWNRKKQSPKRQVSVKLTFVDLRVICMGSTDVTLQPWRSPILNAHNPRDVSAGPTDKDFSPALANTSTVLWIDSNKLSTELLVW